MVSLMFVGQYMRTAKVFSVLVHLRNAVQLGTQGFFFQFEIGGGIFAGRLWMKNSGWLNKLKNVLMVFNLGNLYKMNVGWS